MTVRVLHTADIHLDAPFQFLGQMGAAHRRQIRDTFSRIVTLAAEDRYDLLLIAGDLFDSSRPTRDSVHFVMSALHSTPMPVCILPGNHDFLDQGSVYHQLDQLPNIHVLKEQPTYLPFPRLDLVVGGNPLFSRYENAPQLRDIARTDSTRWFIVMAHGNMPVGQQAGNRARPIDRPAIRATQADYLALGDWHTFADYSAGPVRACYSGAPEPTKCSEEATGKVVSITLSDQGVDVTPLHIGTITAKTLDLSVTNRSEREITQAIRREADPNCLLSVKLNGLKSAAALLDLESIHEEVRQCFYWLQLDDRATLDLDQFDGKEYPEEFVIGQYVRLLRDRIQHAASEQDRRIAEQALQLGLALLNGHRVS